MLVQVSFFGTGQHLDICLSSFTKEPAIVCVLIPQGTVTAERWQ